jgi:hypothetical protein
VKIKTSELTGAALDWAVAKCEGIGLGPRGSVVYYFEGDPAMWQPSTDWAQGGPIIECNLITIFRHDEEWFAHSQLSTPEDFHGDTPLIAAMRCYVASQLGGEVEIPKELT